MLPKENSEINPETVAHFIMMLFSVRDSAHILHLSTKSYAEHKALDEFYNGVVDFTDSFAEMMQGQLGILPYHNFTVEIPSSSLQLLSGLYAWIKTNRMSLGTESYIQNEIDNLVKLIS